MSTTTKQLETYNSDKVIQFIELIALIIMVALPAYYYSSLPDLIPRHYGFNGLPDVYTVKTMIWVFPMTGIMTYGILLLAAYASEAILLSDKKNTEEKKKKIRASIDLVKSFRLFFTVIIAYLTYSSIQVALGNALGLGVWVSPIMFIGIFGIIAYFLFKLKK